MQPSLTIGLVLPPVRHPACGSAVYQQAASALASMSVHVRRFNAAWAYLAEYLMAADTLEAAVDRLRSDSFFDPAIAVDALRTIDLACAVQSSLCRPAMVDRRGFAHPCLDTATALESFIQNPHRNPFWEFARRCGVSACLADRCDLVLFAVQSPGQLVAAASLARMWQQQWPSAGMAVCSHDPLVSQSARQLACFGPLAAPQHAVVQRVQQALNAGGASACGTPLPQDAVLLPDQSVSAISRIVYCALDPASAGRRLDSGPPLDAVVMVWSDPRGDLSELTRLLYQTSVQGAWNHLVLSVSDSTALAQNLALYAQANPNIIHSWCRQEPSGVFSDGRYHFDQGHPPYGRTHPLPGRPLWQWLQDPVYLQAYVDHWGAARLMRTHVLDQATTIHEIGSSLAYHYDPPAQLPSGYLDEICAMVEAGGSVQTHYVRFNLERAFLIAYVEDHGVLVGNSSLKHPRSEYIEAVSRQSGIDLTHYLERGYTSVRPEYRGLGIGARLLEGLTSRAEDYSIFSVIGEENIATQKMAIRNRTRKVATFYSERAQKRVSVWIPEWMVPDGVVLPPQPELK